MRDFAVLALSVLVLVAGGVLVAGIVEADDWSPPDPVVEAAPTTTSILPPPSTTTTTEAPQATVAPDVPAPPPPEPKPAPVKAQQEQASSSYSDARQVVRDVFTERFGAHVGDQAVKVAGCETGGTFDPNSTGRAGEVGMLQLHPRYQSGRAAAHGWSMADLYDPWRNAVVAADLYASSGWGPWTCRKVLG